jgi:NDP-sugar pyrophosphorylase family protein
LVGDFIHHQNNHVIKLDRNDPAESYCSGIQIINPYKINRLMDPAEDFGEVWGKLISKKQLFCSSVFPEKWFTIDTIEQLTQMNSQQS